MNQLTDVLDVALDPAIFRSYDIRGIVDQTLTPSTMFLIGKAFASKVSETGGKSVFVARDGRLSGERMSNALIKGILSAGIDVEDLGMVPTPVLYFAAQNSAEKSGLMVTGSHNPAEYNGVKMVLSGVALTAQAIRALYDRICLAQFTEGNGKYSKRFLSDDYIREIKNGIHLQKPLRVVIDAGSGATGEIAPHLYRQLGCEVIPLHCDIDGRFPHHHPDPTQVENLQDLIEKVKETNADVGLAFDGDGDRVGVVTNRGKIIWADRLLMLFAIALLKKQKGAHIIYDVKCTHHLADLIFAHDGKPIMWKTGHSLIKAKMAEKNALLAGEMSGHFFFQDRWYGFDDGLYAGARLLEILSESTFDLDHLFEAIPNSVNTPEIKINVPDEEKFFLMNKLLDQAVFPEAREVMLIDGVRVNFKDGWGLVRPSNTTPCLVMRFEASNQTVLDEIQTVFRNWMLSVHPAFELPF